MQGSKREAKRGYGRNSLRGEMKFSIKKNKQISNPLGTTSQRPICERGICLERIGKKS